MIFALVFMIDVHCHLNFHAFENDIDDVIKRAGQKGVEKIINVGTSLESSRKAVELANNHENLYAVIGIHPYHADKLENDWEKELINLGKNDKVIGIGEIGMDYYSYTSNDVVDPKIQAKVFEAQIQLAHELELPLQIHNRHAGKDVIEILKHHKNLLRKTPGMFHCFASTEDVLKNLLELGFYVGYDGNITYKGLAPGETVESARLISLTPLDRIVCETDSPYLTPVPYRGGRNEPSYVIIVGEFIGKIKNAPFEKVEKITTENVRNLFKI